jgi:type VI protein secretion system component Hcp
MGYKNTNRRDANDGADSAIVQTWKRLHVPYIQLRPGQGADYIVVSLTGVRIVEVKPPGKENDLTPAEREMMAAANARCEGSYIVITDEIQAAEVATGML